MKKNFTLGIFLALILGLGSNAKAAQFTSGLSLLTNAPISTQTSASNKNLRIGAWNARSTWYPNAGADTVANVANYPLPTYLDDVTISAGDSIYLGANAFCKNLTVNGTVCMFNGTMYVNGDLTVNSAGIFSIKSNAYCSNIYNSGKIWCYNTNANGSPKSLYVGYTYSGTAAVAGTSDYVIQNDGIIGWYRTPSLTSTVFGSGFYVFYSSIAKSLTIRNSAGVNSGYAFTVASLLPVSGLTQSQDFNLNIQQSIALLRISTNPSFSLQNGDIFNAYSRTCTISSGDTVFVAGGFHLKNGTTTAPTANFGNMTYNILGCLDVATLHPNSSANEFNFMTTSFAGNTSSLVINLGDGTAGNPGTLVVGKTFKLAKALAGQTLTFNQTPYSSVVYGYSATNPAFTLTNAGVADNTLFPANYHNLVLNNSGGGVLTLPASLSVNASSLGLTAGKISLNSSNLTASSIAGGSATSYVVTDGTGTLTVPAAAATATTLPIGASATSYDPVTVNATSASNITAKVSATLSGTANTGIYNNAKEWTLASTTPSSTLVTFKPSVEDTNVTSTLSTSAYNALIGVATGSGAYTNYNAAYAGGAYSATFSTLGSFVTGANSLATALTNNSNKSLSVFAYNKSVMVQNAKAGDLVTVFGVNGVKVASSVLSSDNATLPLSTGIYMVKVGSTTTKVAVF